MLPSSPSLRFVERSFQASMGGRILRWRVLTGTVQGREKRDNRDALFTRELQDSEGQVILLTGVADGITQCPFGGAVARWVCRHLTDCRIDLASSPDIPGAVVRTIEEAREAFRTELAGSEDFARSACTLTIGAFAEDMFHGFWVGDSPILISASHGDLLETECVTSPDINTRGELLDQFGASSPLNIKHVEHAMHDGDVVTLATDGFTRVWDPGSLSSAYSEGLFDEGLTRQLLGLPFKDDATFVAIRIGK